MERLEHWQRTQLTYDGDGWSYSQYTHAVIREGHRIVQRLSEEVAARAGGRLTILDVGCAWGDFYQKLRHIAGSYIGVEPSTAQLMRAPRAPNVRLVRGTGECLNLVDGCIDLALQISTLDHCFDARRTMDEVFRVLRPGGTAIILLENRGRLSNDIRRLLGRPIDHGDHLYYFDVQDVLDLVRTRGRVTFVRSHGFLLGFNAAGRLAPWPLVEGLSRVADAVGGRLLPGKGQHFVVAAVKPGEAMAARAEFTCPSCASPFQWGMDGCARCGRLFKWLTGSVLDVLEDTELSRLAGA